MLINGNRRFAGLQPISPPSKPTSNLFTYVYNDPINRIDPSGLQSFPEGMFGVTPADMAAMAARAQSEAQMPRMSVSDYRKSQLYEMHRGIRVDIKDIGNFARPVAEDLKLVGVQAGKGAWVEDVNFEGENFKLVWVWGGVDRMRNIQIIVVGVIVSAPAGPEGDKAAAQEWFSHVNQELLGALAKTAVEVVIMSVSEIWALRAARNVRNAARAVETERAALRAERAVIRGEKALDRAPLFAKTTEVGSDLLPAGSAHTDKFGNVVYSTLGSADDVALARLHESVHSLLSPKLNMLREFRADVGMAAYQRSSLVRYLEEALSETYAQLRVRGFKGLPTGIAFPVKEGYVTLRATLTEGAIATVVVGGTTYGIYYVTNK